MKSVRSPCLIFLIKQRRPKDCTFFNNSDGDNSKLAGIIGWGAIDSGIIALEDSQGWTFEDEMRRGEQLENQRQKMIQECYAKGGDSLICDR